MSFLEAVNEKYGELSPVQKRIADYMYKYSDEACFYSLREMANALGVTEVTVLRFARKLGFDSYVDMKKNLRDHLQARLLGNETLRPASAHSMTGTRELDHEAMFKEFVANELQVLKNTYSQCGLEQVLTAVSLIRQAGTVYAIGNELAAVGTAYLTRRLMTIGIRVEDLGSQSRALYIDHLIHAGPEDVAVIFSNPGYAKHVVNTVKYLNEKRVPQIVITDKISSPVAAYATVVLTYDNHDLYYYNSVLGFFSLTNLIAYFTAVGSPEDTTRLRNQILEARESIGTISMYKDSRGRDGK